MKKRKRRSGKFSWIVFANEDSFYMYTIYTPITTVYLGYKTYNLYRCGVNY